MASNDLLKAISERRSKRQSVFDELQEKFDKASNEQRIKWENIRALEFCQLKEKLQEGELSALDALHAYQYQALIAQYETNCVAQFITEAEQWAKELDLKYSESAKPPLFGIPFSVKEHLQVKNYDSTCGLAQRLGKLAQEDFIQVQLLREHGAIPFVITNFPQFNGSFTCSNPIYGRTSHPLDQLRTPGGSSGGEAALLSMGGSPLGIGSDGGGSIRIPASFCGIAGFKPTAKRMSLRGSIDVLPGVQTIGIVTGPMAPTVDALVEFMKNVLDGRMTQIDPYVPLVPFNAEICTDTKAKLTIGYYDHDGWFEPTHANRRAVHMVLQKLGEMGHELVPFQPDKIEDVAVWFGSAFTMDGGRLLLKLLDKDIADEVHKPLFCLYRLPYIIKRSISWLLSWFYPRLGVFSSCFSDKSSDLRHAHACIEEYRTEFVTKWKAAGLDCVICPAFAHPAPPHDLPIKCTASLPYTALYNVLDFPAGVVPVTTVTQEDEFECMQYDAKDPWASQVKQAFSKNSVGLPVGVQCATLPFKDELCLRVMKLIETVVKSA